MKKLFSLITLMLVVMLVAACAASPELPARSAANPIGVDLSGRWVLQGADGTPRSVAGGMDQGIRLPPASGRRQQGPSRTDRSRRSKGPAVHVFIENGRVLKITQTAHGLFVSFDRSVVEEYTFGENRVISLGPIEAQRVSGWDGAVLVVETMDDSGAMLTETWELANGANELLREVRVMEGEKELHSFRQVFDRT